MTLTPGFVLTVVAIVAWGTFVWRVVAGLRRPPEANARERALSRLAWFANLCFAVATTSIRPTDEQLLQSEWVQRVPLYVIGLASTTALGIIAGEISPRHRQSTTRLIGLALLAFGLFAGLGYGIERGWLPVEGYAREQLIWPALPFNAFILWLSARITLPAFWTTAQHEQFRPMQIRLQTIAAHQALQILWQGVAFVEFLTVLMGLRLVYVWAYIAVGVPLVLLFFVYMGPREVFVIVARVIDYVDSLVSYILIARLTGVGVREVARALEERLLDLEETELAWVSLNHRLFAVRRLAASLPDPRAAFQDPVGAVTRTLIVLFDLRKTLDHTRTDAAQALSRTLAPLAAPEVETHVLIHVLRGAAWTRLGTLDPSR